MRQIDIEQAQQHLSDLIAEVMNGQDILITRDHRPLVRLIDVHSQTSGHATRRPGTARGLIKIAEDFGAPLEDFREYM